MAFKLIAFATLVAAANAGFLPVAAPLPYAAHLSHSLPLVKTVVAKPIDTEYDHHPQYSYGYDVHDTLTGDAKNQQETRDGDVVKGSYSLIEADGTRRVVKYTADPIHGFNAVVHKEPATLAVKAIAPAHVAHVAPLTYAHAPAHTYAHAPAHAYVQAPAHTYVQAPAHTYAQAPAHTYVQAPVHTYAHAPAHTYAVPVAKYTPASLASHVSYSAPAAAYVH